MKPSLATWQGEVRSWFLLVVVLVGAVLSPGADWVPVRTRRSGRLSGEL